LNSHERYPAAVASKLFGQLLVRKARGAAEAREHAVRRHDRGVDLVVRVAAEVVHGIVRQQLLVDRMGVPAADVLEESAPGDTPLRSLW